MTSNSRRTQPEKKRKKKKTTQSTTPSDEAASFYLSSNAGLDPRGVRNWKPQAVTAWIRRSGFSTSIAQLFTEHEISGDLLFQLDDKQLMALGIAKLGIRTKILLSISDLQNSETSSSRTTNSTNDSSSSSNRGGSLRGDIDRLRRATNMASGCADLLDLEAQPEHVQALPPPKAVAPISDDFRELSWSLEEEENPFATASMPPPFEVEDQALKDEQSSSFSFSSSPSASSSNLLSCRVEACSLRCTCFQVVIASTLMIVILVVIALSGVVAWQQLGEERLHSLRSHGSTPMKEGP